MLSLIREGFSNGRPNLTAYHLGFRGDLCKQFEPTKDSLSHAREVYNSQEINAILENVHEYLTTSGETATFVDCGCPECKRIVEELKRYYK